MDTVTLLLDAERQGCKFTLHEGQIKVTGPRLPGLAEHRDAILAHLQGRGAWLQAGELFVRSIQNGYRPGTLAGLPPAVRERMAGLERAEGKAVLAGDWAAATATIETLRNLWITTTSTPSRAGGGE